MHAMIMPKNVSILWCFRVFKYRYADGLRTYVEMRIAVVNNSRRGCLIRTHLTIRVHLG